MSLSNMLSGSDSELQNEVFHKFKNGDQASFKTIFEFYYSLVYKFVASIINHKEDAADIANDTFVTLWKTKAGLKEATALKSYLLTVSANAARNYLKKNKVAKRYVREMIHTTEEAEQERNARVDAVFFFQLEQLMTVLPTGCRSVFEMIYFQNLETEEIAQKLGITNRTVLNQKSKAVQLLRKGIQLQNNLVLLELYETWIRHH